MSCSAYFTDLQINYQSRPFVTDVYKVLKSHADSHVLQLIIVLISMFKTVCYALFIMLP
jgi:hypothetical protein